METRREPTTTASPSIDDRLLTAPELAEVLRVPVKGIYRLAKAGMPSVRISAGRIRFDVQQVRAWLESRGRTDG